MSHHCQPEQDSVGVKLRPFPIERTFRCVVVRVFEYTLFFPLFFLLYHGTPCRRSSLFPSSFSSFVFVIAFFTLRARNRFAFCCLDGDLSVMKIKILSKSIWNLRSRPPFFYFLKKEEKENSRTSSRVLFRLPLRSVFLPLSCF